MFKKIIYIYIYIVLVALIFNYWWIKSEIIFSNRDILDYSLFIPIIIFTILLYFWEKIKYEKKSMYFAVFTFIFSLISWIWFYFYTVSNF